MNAEVFQEAEGMVITGGAKELHKGWGSYKTEKDKTELADKVAEDLATVIRKYTET